MHLVNTSPAVANLAMGDLEGTPIKYGMLTAKLTYSISREGELELDTQNPLPLLRESAETELGLIPSDSVARRDDVLEVVVLGAAYSGGEPSCEIRLRVGTETRRIQVFGNRRWEGKGSDARISSPEPFERMPLTWSRAFGGRCELKIDEWSALDINDAMNAQGRGFDVDKMAEDVGKAFECSNGYPEYDYERLLPNLEDPECLIQDWSDAPLPVCWATVPKDIGFGVRPQIDQVEQTGEPMSMKETLRHTMHQAHSTWVIPRPAANQSIEMINLTSERELRFGLPQVQVFADYELGDRAGTRELMPHMLLLLPEERRLCLVFRHFFTMETAPDMPRSFRLRLEEGWYS